jgi:NADPH:quinone reductase-like Zn-dependent oxidoreductase
MKLPTTQRRAVLIREADGSYRLAIERVPVPVPGEHDVVVRVHAVSLNRRDVYLKKGHYPMPPRPSLVPMSDGAGEICSVGSRVTRFRTGDHVAGIFFQSWLRGRQDAATMPSALGGQLDGMLAEFVCLREEGVVALPEGLTFEEGATLPCAGVTAWNALVTRGRVQSGDFVLLLGTGGVAVFGLQFATAAGARPLVTSSSDAKLARARSLGAVATVNYAQTPDWAGSVRAATGGIGVHHVLEVGGVGTLPKSLASLAPGGHIALIGGLAGFGGEVPSMALIVGNATASGVYVGSREHFEAMNRFIEQHRIRPVIDRVFDFDSVAEAYDHVDQGRHFGKVVIKL